jgi:hypothetical protein
MLTPEVLEGASKIVFDHMVLSSLGYGAAHQPTLDFWQSEAGDWQGFNIVAHFPPSTKVAQATLEDLASTAIGQIPTKALLESISGRTFTSVLSFREGDDNSIEKDSSRYPDDLPVDLKEDLYRPGNVKPHMLKGPAAEVWKFCKENGLEPTLEYWETSSDEGTFSGYEIVIHWFQEAAATADEKLYRDGMLPTTT